MITGTLLKFKIRGKKSEINITNCLKKANKRSKATGIHCIRATTKKLCLKFYRKGNLGSLYPSKIVCLTLNGHPIRNTSNLITWVNMVTNHWSTILSSTNASLRKTSCILMLGNFVNYSKYKYARCSLWLLWLILRTGMQWKQKLRNFVFFSTRLKKISN